MRLIVISALGMLGLIYFIQPARADLLQEIGDCLLHGLAGEDCGSAEMGINQNGYFSPRSLSIDYDFHRLRYPQSVKAIQNRYGQGTRYGNRLYYGNQYRLSVNEHEQVVSYSVY